jgi:hypothetical protein
VKCKECENGKDSVGCKWIFEHKCEDSQWQNTQWLSPQPLCPDIAQTTTRKEVLSEIDDWVGPGRYPTLHSSKDGDIVRGVLELLHHRVHLGFPTFFVKLRPHRGEPYNEAAYRLAYTTTNDEEAKSTVRANNSPCKQRFRGGVCEFYFLIFFYFENFQDILQKQ